MPLDDLVNVIETLQQRIKDHGDSLRQNEYRTRAALIDPLLRALGWDVADPGLVTPEYSAGNGRADYALLGGNGNPAAFIEAKHFGEPLERPQHTEQVFTYALIQQVRYAGLTDGNLWVLYDVAEFSGGERRLLQVSMANEPAHQCALQLLLLWRPNLASGRPVAAGEPILAGALPTANAVKPVVNTPPPAPAPPHLPGEGWTSLGDLPPDISSRGKPSLIRFPSGEERAIQPRRWKRVLIAVAEWLIGEGALTEDECPIGQAPELHIIHSEPVHPSGRTFFHPALLSNALFLASASNSTRAASDCIFLMQLCNQDPASVHLKLG